MMMKKLIIAAFLAFFVTSCAVVPRYAETQYIFDFRQYIESGFKITPSQTLNEMHDCLAIITIEAKSGKSGVNINSGVEVISGEGYVESYRSDYKEPNAAEMLSELVKYAKSLGANGIIDLQFSQHSVNGGKYGSTRRVVTISGCAVNIKTAK